MRKIQYLVVTIVDGRNDFSFIAKNRIIKKQINIHYDNINKYFEEKNEKIMSFQVTTFKIKKGKAEVVSFYEYKNKEEI